MKRQKKEEWGLWELKGRIQDARAEQLLLSWAGAQTQNQLLGSSWAAVTLAGLPKSPAGSLNGLTALLSCAVDGMPGIYALSLFSSFWTLWLTNLPGAQSGGGPVLQSRSARGKRGLRGKRKMLGAHNYSDEHPTPFSSLTHVLLPKCPQPLSPHTHPVSSCLIIVCLPY